jgi:hypothetical protein
VALFHHTFSGTTPGETWSFNIHTTGAGTLAAAQAGAVAAATALWTGALDAFIADDVVLTEVSTASLDEATDRQISRLADDVNLPGVSVGESLPFQCALAVSWRTDFATRAGRGRIYLPPISVANMAGGRVGAGSVTGIVDAVNAFWGALDTAGLALVIRSKTSHTSVAVTGGNVGNVIDTQRRRRNKLIEIRTPLTAP